MRIKKTRWWHFERPREYYQCHILGGGPPLVKHKNRAKARREAVRLAATYGLPVYVLRSVEVVLPQQPAPHPGIDVFAYDYGYVVDCWKVG